MAVEQKEYSIIEMEGFTAVGIRWEGTFLEAAEGGIRRIQEELKKRLEEITFKVDPCSLLGLSYHASSNSDGFTHYAAVQVKKVDAVPEGMVTVEVPGLTYATCEHKKGENIEQSYNLIYSWIKQEGLKASTSELTHFEIYSMAQDPYNKDPEFTIQIPLSKE